MTTDSVLTNALVRVSLAECDEPVASFQNYAAVTCKLMDFSGALGFLRSGRAVRRRGWGHQDGIELQGGGTLIVHRGLRTPWAPTQASVLAQDWELVPLGS